MEEEMKKQKREGRGDSRKYSHLGSIFWALGKLWELDTKFIFFIFAGVPLAVAIPLTEAYFPKALLDRLGAGGDFSQLFMICAGFLFLLMLLEILRGWLASRRDARHYYPTSVFQTKMDEHEKYCMDFQVTEKQAFKEKSGYAWRDACQGGCAMEFVWQDLSDMLTHLFGIFTYASFLAVLNPIIFVVVAAVSAMSYVTTRLQPKYYEKHKKEWEKEIRKKNYLQQLSEDFPRAKDIKLYGLSQWLETMMRDYQDYILMWDKRCSLRGLFASVLSAAMALLQNGTAYLVLIASLLSGAVSVGEFVFYFGLVGGIAGFLQGIIGDVAKLGMRADKIAYYREFYDFPNIFNHGEGCELPASPVLVEFKDVWFRYDGAKEYTLKGISLTIREGEKLALVGVNGAGKTTIVKLLCGFYQPEKGEILVGGKNILEYNIMDYYSMISAVFQEIKAVAFTVFEFVASADLFREHAREDAVFAMERAGIYEKVKSLPNGMDTHLMKGVYDDGVDFSGGEMQKLVLARAIYKDGRILVLDEPTAALDPIAENNLYLKYQELTRGKTSVYISHRFASTRFCDRIVLLEDGVVKESGSHGELMEAGGKYAYMFGVQSQYYREAEEAAAVSAAEGGEV